MGITVRADLANSFNTSMSWKANVVLLALSFFGVGSLVYLLYKRDEEKEIQDCLKLKTSRCTVIEVKIPADSVGLVIGRGGSTIKEIQLKSDTRINFKDEKASDEYRVCIIRGTAEAAQYAESLIHEVIVSQPFIETFEMMVPVIAIGRIIGKNGENIRQISRNSNAKITIENATISQGATERKITIKGTPEQIASGKVLIEQKVDEDFEFRKKIERNLANRSPRHKPKALMPGKADDEEAVKTFDHKERLVATGSDGLFEVYTSALESPDKLWVQMKGPCTAELDILNDQMTEYYSRKENREIHVLTEVNEGQTVAAPFMYDEKWYRAEVAKISTDNYEPEETVLTLYYVDYGDTLECKKENVFELRTDFLRLRFQAIECILAKVKPSGDAWSEEGIDLMEDLTHVGLWQPMTAKVHGYKERPTRAKREGSPVPCVELFDSQAQTTINVAEELVKKGFAVWDVDPKDVSNGEKVLGAKSAEVKDDEEDVNSKPLDAEKMSANQNGGSASSN